MSRWSRQGLRPESAPPGHDLRRDLSLRRFSFAALVSVLVVSLILVLGLGSAHSASNPPAPQLSSGSDHTCGVTAAGGLACWGQNQTGQLGTGDLTKRDRATDVPGLRDVTSVSAVNDQTCAVADGHLYCWGAASGALYPVLRPHGTPVDAGFAVSSPIEIAGVRDGVDVALSSVEVCVRRRTGALRCLQGNFGRKTERLLAPQAGLPHVEQLAAGVDHLCARSRGGAVRCWGDRPGRETDESETDRTRAPGVAVPALRGATSLGLTLTSTCGAFKSGAVRCVGSSVRRSRTLRGATGVQDLVGGQQLCAIGAAGDLRCLGYDGQSSDDDGTLPATPPLTDIVAATAGTGRTCAQRRSGEVLCWGTSTTALGSGQAETPESAVTVPGLDRVVAITAGGAQTCAVRDDHTMLCWGRTNAGATTPTLVPTAIPGITDAASVAVADGDGCAVGTSGAVRCWGAIYVRFNAAEVIHTAPPGAAISGMPGCLAAGGSVDCVAPKFTTRDDAPVRLTVDHPKWIQGATSVVTTDDDTICGRFPDRTVTCGVVEEGDPGNYYDDAVIQVPGFTDVTSVVAYSRAVCALRASGSVACWNGHSGARGPAKDVPGLAGASAIDLEGAQLCAIVEGGRVRCLTAGISSDPFGPKAVARDIAGVAAATALALGSGGGCALQAGGTVACWGSGADGRLGDGPMPAGHGPQLTPGAPVLDFTGPSAG